MKFVKIAIGCLAGIYTIAQVIQLIIRLSGENNTPYALGGLLGCGAGILIGLAISLTCFKSAFRNPAKRES